MENICQNSAAWWWKHRMEKQLKLPYIIDLCLAVECLLIFELNLQ